MAVTSVTTSMAGAINYTVVTDSSADWASVANSTYFYDKADKLVHYKDSTGNIQEIFSGSGITVGTTAVTSGTDTRVFFQAGGVIQQDANFTFDNTLKRLTLKAVGTAATDIPFAVQDSAGTTTLLKVQGNQQTVIQSGPFATYTFTQDVNQAATFMLRTTGNSQAELGNDFGAAPGNFYTGALKLYNWSSVLRTRIQAVGTSYWADPTAVVSIGSSTNGARLDVRAQGALSTDIAFRVRNSADTLDILQVRGDTRIIQNVNANTALSRAGYNVLGENTDVWSRVATTGNQPRVTGFSTQGQVESISMFVESGATTVTGVGGSHVWFAQTGYGYFGSIGGNSLGFKFGTTTGSVLSNSTGTLAMLSISNNNYNQSVFALGTYLGTTNTQPSATYGGNTFFIKNGTAPTATATDTFALYSEDITAGNAAPHFRTENGAIVKVYQETTGVAAATLVGNAGTNITDTDTFDGYTIQQIVKALRNQGLLA